MENIENELNQFRNSGEDVWIAGGVSEEKIKELESVLKLSFSNSYRDFLLKYGAIGINDRFISGITGQDIDEGGGSILSDTKYFRETFTLPNNLFIIEANEDAPYCLDSSSHDSDGEFAIVCYEIHSRKVKVISKNFMAWLKDFFLYHEKL